MKNLTPYLTFSGECREAMNFYADCFNGEVKLQTFKEAGTNFPEPYSQHIMHAELHAGDLVLFASDAQPDFVASVGNTISMTVNMDDEAEQDSIFNKLSVGGVVTQPLQTTFWGARFAMLNDRYGVQWMLNCMKPAGK
jgi:PhnB protein